MANFVPDEHFKQFVATLQLAIIGNSPSDKDLATKQKFLVESLVKAEKRFKKVLQRDSRGHLAYKAFIKYILHERKNILASRPFFRERQGEFSKGISPAIKKNRHKDLYKFDVNYTFIAFVLSRMCFGKNSKITKAADEVHRIRKTIIEQNIPLAISRAKIFRKNTPEAHLSYMDLVQISMEGLIDAVDKFVLPYTPVFRGVIIGRITGDLIENYSEKMLHFYPLDKRKIYWANKLQKDKNNVNFDKLSSSIGENMGVPNITSPSEIQHLMTASSHFSLDFPTNETEGEPAREVPVSERYVASEDGRPDIMYEKEELNDKLYRSIECLRVLEVKFLKMKGLNHGQ